MKRLILFFFSALLSFSYSSAQNCVNLIYSSCVTLGDTIVLTPDNGFSAFWEITDPSGSVITPGFPVNYSASYALAVTQTGVYTVEVDQSNTTQCLETFTINVYSSPFSISPLSIPNALSFLILL